jgi:hypothetical protein
MRWSSRAPALPRLSWPEATRQGASHAGDKLTMRQKQICATNGGDGSIATRGEAWTVALERYSMQN